MGEPQPHDPEDRPDPNAPRPLIERADWLVGPESGLAAESRPRTADSGAHSAPPRLGRPEYLDAGAPGAASRAAAAAGSPGVSPTPSGSMPTWNHGKSSIPMLHRSGGEGSPSRPIPIPELVRDFPMDDAEERARVAALVAEQQAEEAAIAARPHAVVAPQEFDIPAVPVAWWLQLPHLLRSDRRVQMALLAVGLAIAAVTFWPREEKTISVAHLKEHADRYADTHVRVGGRVAEVFPVGGSWAYSLVQGRDTIVVFSRTRRPKSRERIVVVGTLSNGYLDGQSRAAIFESTR